MKRNSMLKAFRRSFWVVVFVSSLLLLNACSTAVEERVEQVGGVTAQQIIDNPSAYVGKTVTVSGDIDKIHDTRAFNIDSGASIGELLVLGTSPFPNIPGEPGRTIIAGDVATVTGVVRMLTTVTEVEREIGWDLTPEIETTYKTKPVLIAKDTKFVAGTPAAKNPRERSVDPVIDDTKVAPSANDAEIVNFADYEKAVDRKSYVGKRVRLEAINVESVVGDRAFYVGTSPSKRILIVFEEEAPDNVTKKGFDGKIDIDKGQKVTIDGVVRAMPSVEEAKARFGKLMTAETLAGLRNETTYIYTDDPRIVSTN